MPDPDRVREALEWWGKMSYKGEMIEAVEAAARSWLEGTEIRWCEYHESRGGKTYCRYGYLLGDRGDCRIVSRRLVGGE